MSHAPHPTPRPEATVPHSEYFKDGRLKIVIVGLDKNIRPQAKEVADDKLLEKRSQGGFKGFINRIWYGTYGKETFLARATQQAQQEIVEHDQSDRDQEPAEREAPALQHAKKPANDQRDQSDRADADDLIGHPVIRARSQACLSLRIRLSGKTR